MNGANFLLMGYLMQNIKFCEDMNAAGDLWVIKNYFAAGRKVGPNIDVSERWQTKEKQN
jgi:hypothetical protein